MATVTLATMRARARRRANQETLDQTQAFITDAEIDENLNYHLEVVYTLLVNAREQYYYRTDGTFLSSGRDVLLPDYLQILSVDWVRGQNDNVALAPYVESERGQFMEGANLNSVPPMYQLRPLGIRLAPAPSVGTNLTLQVAYIRKFVRLELDADTFEGVAGWEDYAIAKTAAYMLVKDQDQEGAAYHEQQAATIQARILADAQNRNAGIPSRIQRTYRNRQMRYVRERGAESAGAPPTITSISPDIGTNIAGQAITITGDNFVGVTDAKVGSTPITGLVVVSATKITGVMPVTIAGLLPLTVSNSAGTTTKVNAFASLEVAGLTHSLHHAGGAVTEVGGFVTAVADSGNSLRPLNSGGTILPTLIASDAAYNGKPVFAFSANNSHLKTAPVSDLQPVTCFLVGNTNGSSSTQYLLDGFADFCSIIGNAATDASIYAGATLTVPGNLSVTQVFSAVFNNLTSFASQSSNTETAGNGGPGVPGGFYLGSYRAGGFGSLGKIALCLRISGNLSKAQRDTNRTTLGAYYGKAIS
jgi:IPT/TIG domain